MDGLDLFLETYGLAAASAVMLTKAAGVPIPIPGDVILLAMAARAAQGKLLIWQAFAALLIALTLGGLGQFLLARGPGRRVLLRFGRRLGLTTERLDRVAASVQRGGLLAIGVAVLTPGVRTAVVPACGLAGVPLRVFLPGLVLGSGVDLGLHFAIGYAGAGLLAAIVQPSPLMILAALLLIGLGAWLVIARRRRASRAAALDAWAQATCPVCLVLGGVAVPEAVPAVRWSRGS